MKFEDVILNRQSVREFEKRAIEANKIKRLKEVINSAPSAGDLQAYEVFEVKDGERKRKLSDAAYGQDYVHKCSLLLVFCANAERSSGKYGRRGAELYAVQDATIAAAYAQLAATDEGLASVWVGAFDETKAKAVLETEWKPVAMICVGYPAEKPYKTPRRRIEDVFHDA